MRRCRCGARWRINYPFGRNSKPRITFIKKHHNKCRYSEKIIKFDLLRQK